MEIAQHLLLDKKPSDYLGGILSLPELSSYPLELLGRLKDTKQSPQYHPEGSVWNHTLMVVDEAARVKNRSSYPDAFMWAALLHDIGKPSTTRIRKGKITSYNHDKEGARLAELFLTEFTQDNALISHVCMLIRYHMQILFVVKDLPFADLEGIKQNGDINDIALLGLCDRLGRLGVDRKQEKNNIRLFIEKCAPNS